MAVVRSDLVRESSYYWVDPLLPNLLPWPFCFPHEPMVSLSRAGRGQWTPLADILWSGDLVYLVVHWLFYDRCSLVGINMQCKVLYTCCPFSCVHPRASSPDFLVLIFQSFSIQGSDQSTRPFTTDCESVYILSADYLFSTQCWWLGIVTPSSVH